MVKKEEIRKKVLSLREAMEKGEWDQKTRNITKRVTSHPLFLQAEENLLLYGFPRGSGDSQDH